ncbi:g-type lectin s-receptor-like serine/threonine-protein kinase lecrk1 [Quercus suber]|uniref:G-type lectin s-receptor-like serine/threonine-protein kinase lecrk1 n=1 Tax=Quercus suber TaxID=58331 RepID=A0AAW0LX77_QUESU
MPWNIDSTLAINVRSYTYKELEQATMGFKPILGKGAFGTVYKADRNDEEARNDMKRLERLVIVALLVYSRRSFLRPTQ